ncbi:MAG TPA: hypothetical protein VK013_18760 [Myxococcaceae bacterium]|nr:hypothetical protein [Myxococcaceae bacterium]
MRVSELTSSSRLLLLALLFPVGGIGVAQAQSSEITVFEGADADVPLEVPDAPAAKEKAKPPPAPVIPAAPPSTSDRPKASVEIREKREGPLASPSFRRGRRPRPPDGVGSGRPAPTGWRIAGAAELGAQPLALAPGETDVFLSLTPYLAISAGQRFELELGSPLRLPVGAITGAKPFALRPEDWDERSDWGQVLRHLRIGHDTDAVGFEAGRLTQFTLGRGSLIYRYENRMLATQSPAGAHLRVETGPVRTDVVASDVLALRVLAGEVRIDGGHLVAGSPAAAGRWHMAVSAAHEGGQVAAESDALTLANLDLDAVLWRAPTFQLAAFGSLGARLGIGGDNLGAQLGVEWEAQLSEVVFGARFAGRRFSGGFKHGYFGAAYELERLSAQGFTGLPLADVRLPAGFSGHALAQVGWGAQAREDVVELGRTRGTLSVGVEHFDFGRTDVEAAVQWDLAQPGVSLSSRLGVSGLGQTPLTWVHLEGRGRLAPAIYVVAGAGTTFAPREGGGLTRGWMANAGVGFDFDARF